MPRDGYFTGLLNGTQDNTFMGCDGLSSPPEEQDSPNGGSAATEKGNKKRLKNFSEGEDLLLVRAWLNIGTDPLQGTDQKRSAYWTRVYDFFHAEKGIVLDRSQNSLAHCWSFIQESVNRFCGCLTRIEGRNESGKTFENKLMDACTLYKSEDKESKSFVLMHCWNILRHEPKWNVKMNQLASQKSCKKKHKASTDSLLDLTGNLNDTNEDASPESDAPKRPIGRKKAKQILRRGGGDHAH